MKTKLFFLFVSFFLCTSIFSQNNPLDKFSHLIGKWEGNGEGFSATKSTIKSEFNWIMNGAFIEVKNHSKLEPTPQNSNGEGHVDYGIISFDKARKSFVFRQYHNEGFFNRYILNDSLSNQKSLIFESELIENFVPGGTARFTINIKSETEIETLFDVGFPGREMACFGKNQLTKK